MLCGCVTGRGQETAKKGTFPKKTFTGKTILPPFVYLLLLLTERANVYLSPTNRAFGFCASLLFVLGGIQLSPLRSQGLMEFD